MNNSEYTPGPWVAQEDGYAVRSEEWLIGTPDGRPDEVAVCSKRDAALIAAAPDLLEALIAITNQLERIGDTREHKDGAFIRDARAAIAKATGSAV